MCHFKVLIIDVFQNVVAQNKFAFLQEEDVGGGSSEEN